MNTFLFCSLYYKKNLVTGANKRFENFIFYFLGLNRTKTSLAVPWGTLLAICVPYGPPDVQNFLS